MCIINYPKETYKKKKKKKKEKGGGVKQVRPSCRNRRRLDI